MGKLYSKYKIFNYPSKISSLPRERDPMPPVHVRIKPTNRCNHDCFYCSYRNSEMQIGKNMLSESQIPKDKMYEIIDDLMKMKVKAVTLSGGGEPLIYPYIQETLEKLKHAGINFAVITNGIELSGNVAKILAESGSWVRISIDGWDAKSYQHYRNCHIDEYNRVILNIKNFAKIKRGCKLGISIIVDRNNYKHVYSQCQYFKELGVDSIKVSSAIFSNDVSTNNQNIRYYYDELKELMTMVVNELVDNNFSVYDSIHYFDNNFIKSYDWCPYCQILPVIGADLNIYSCQDKAYNLQDGLLGTIKQQSFFDFWMKGKNKFFEINPRISCRHHCVANEKNKLLIEYLELDDNHLSFV